MRNRVPRVKAEIGGKTSIGTAFPIAEVVEGGTRRVLLISARHVVYPDGDTPGTPTSLTLSLPAADDPAVAGQAYAAAIHLDGAAGLADGDSADLGQDWVVLAADLPATVVPLAWGVLEPVEVDLALDRQERTEFQGVGYPDGNANELHGMGGTASRPTRVGGVPYLQLGVNQDLAANVDPRGYSGGPMLVGEAVAAIFTRSKILESRLVGAQQVGGTMHARPLLGVLTRIQAAVAAGRTAAIPISAPVPLTFGPLTAEVVQVLRATRAVLDAVGTAGLAALDRSAAAAFDIVAPDVGFPTGSLLAKGEPLPHSFVRAVQRLLPQAIGPGGVLARFVEHLARAVTAVGPAFAQVSVLRTPTGPPVGPVSAPASSELVLDVTWATLDRRSVRVSLRERRAEGMTTLATRDGLDVDPEAIVAACGALLGPSGGGLGEARPVEVWVPPELVGAAFDEAPVDLGDDGQYAVGGLAPVTLRVRWDTPLPVPPDVVAHRAQALSGFVLPQQLAGPFGAGTLPADGPTAVRLAPDANAAAWHPYARKERGLLLVTVDKPPALTTKDCPARAVLRGGVPVLAWERVPAEKLVPLLIGAAPATTIRRRILDFRVANADVRMSLILAPPDDPLPDDPLLSPL